MKNTKNNNKVIDITGVSAIGKSTWLDENCNEDALMYSIKSTTQIFTTIGVVHQHLRLLIFCFFDSYLSFSDIIWLLKSSAMLKDSLRVRLNVFRNCLLKFLVQKDSMSFSNKINGKTIYIDEGISHIPFLLQNQKNDSQAVSNEYYLRFSKKLSNLNVICLTSNADTFTRLKKRGHKRLVEATDSEINNFVKMNYNTLSILKKNSHCFATFELKEIGI